MSREMILIILLIYFPGCFLLKKSSKCIEHHYFEIPRLNYQVCTMHHLLQLHRYHLQTSNLFSYSLLVQTSVHMSIKWRSYQTLHLHPDVNSLSFLNSWKLESSSQIQLNKKKFSHNPSGVYSEKHARATSSPCNSF